MSFSRYRDFRDYVNKVRMKASFKDSHLASRDVSYFTSELDQMNLELDVDGQITGLVKNLRAKKLSIKAGKATHIKGDFALKGLPVLKETFMDLKIEMAGTNKKDLDDLLTSVTGKKLRKSLKSFPNLVTSILMVPLLASKMILSPMASLKQKLAAWSLMSI